MQLISSDYTLNDGLMIDVMEYYDINNCNFIDVDINNNKTTNVSCRMYRKMRSTKLLGHDWLIFNNEISCRDLRVILCSNTLYILMICMNQMGNIANPAQVYNFIAGKLQKC